MARLGDGARRRALTLTVRAVKVNVGQLLDIAEASQVRAAAVFAPNSGRSGFYACRKEPAGEVCSRPG
jgi:hypothetical protein